MLKAGSHFTIAPCFDRRCGCLLKTVRTSLPIFLVFCFGIRFSAAMQVTSEISGTVMDQSGSPITGAEVVIRADATGAVTKSTTESDGHFVSAGLLPGVYTITASCKGFTTKIFSRVDLTLNQSIRLDVTLTVSSTTEKITVVGSPPLLDFDTSSTGGTILPAQVDRPCAYRITQPSRRIPC